MVKFYELSSNGIASLEVAKERIPKCATKNEALDIYRMVAHLIVYDIAYSIIPCEHATRWAKELLALNDQILDLWDFDEKGEIVK
jgi:hypothetical protein